MSDENCSQPDARTPADAERLPSGMLQTLYARYEAELSRFLVGVLRDTHLAADALQATFIKLAERGHQVRAETVKGWLYRVAYHEAMWLRRRQNVDDAAVRRAAWSRTILDQPADAGLLRQETVELVRQAIGELSAEQQQMVRMRIYEEKTFAVIAAELGIPLGTALARMRTALVRLRQKLERQQ